MGAGERGSERTVVTVGTFDGVHRGHQALLARTRRLARERGLASVALTFACPPQNYLGRVKPLILPPEVKLELLRGWVDRVVVLDFPEVRPLTPRAFVGRVLVGRLGASWVVAGPNFRFGRDRQGDVGTLRELGAELGFGVDVIGPVAVGGEPVSSSAVREALSLGDVGRAGRLLGRAPQLFGEVVPGTGEGRKLGFPTANLAVHPEVLLPAAGVYAVRVALRGRPESRWPGVFYLGRRPTFDQGAGVALEVHILTADPDVLDLYGEELELELVRYLREDRRFASVDGLRAQIQADVEAVRALLARPARRWVN